MSDATPPLQIKRAAWHTRVQGLVFGWFAAAAVVAATRFDDWAWFLVHFLMLGAVSNALFIWSWHFTGAILRVPDQADRSAEIQRLALLNLGIAGTVIAVRVEAPAMIVASVGFILAAVVLHARAMKRAARRALASPYAFTVDAYIAACALLVPGLLLGAWMEMLDEDSALLPKLMLAHVSLNLLGWVGLPILGTIVTLWPTMLRTRIAPNAALLGRRSLPFLIAGVLITAIGFGIGASSVAAAGALVYLVGYVRTMKPIATVTRAKAPAAFSTWTTLAGLCWLFLAVLGLGVSAAAHTVEPVADALSSLAFVGVVGVVQVLIGCMSYLVPAMAAGGPAIVRLRNDIADSAMVVRFALINAGAAIACAVTGTSRFVGASMLGAGFVWSIVRIALTTPTPSPDRVAAADEARVWVDEKEVRRFPFGRR